MPRNTPASRRAMTKAELLNELDASSQKIAALEAKLEGMNGGGAEQQTFRKLIEESHQAVFVRRGNTAVFANRAYAGMFGYDSPEEMIGTDHQDFIAPEDQDWMAQYRKERLQGKQLPTRYQYRAIRKDGSMIWIDGTRQIITWRGEQAVLVTLSDITAQKQAEEQLQESEERLQQVFNSLPHTMGLKDTSGRYRMVNKAWLEFTGCAREDVIGKTITEIGTLTEEERSSVLEADEKALQANGPAEWFLQSLTDFRGDSRTFHSLKVPLRDSMGKVTGMISMGLDVTGKLQAEEQLRESEERLRSFMDSAGDVFNIFDENLNLLELSLSSLKKWGGSREEKLGKHITELFPGAEQPGRLDRYLKVLETGEPIEFDGYMDTPLMGRLFVRRKVFPVGSGLGIISTDLTDLQHAREELAESAERFRAIAEATPYAMFIVAKKDGQWLYANARVREMFDVGEDISNISALDSYWEPSERQEFLDIMERDGKVAGMERRRKRADGGMFWASISSVSMRFAGQDAFLTSIIDITERRQAQEALRDSRNLLQTMFDSMPLSVYVKDTERRYVMVNRVHAESSKIDPEGIKGMLGQDVPQWSESEKQHALVEDGLVLEQGETVDIPERRIVRQDGSVVWQRIIKAPILDDNGEVTGLVGIRENITERIEAAQKFQESQALLQTIFDTLLVGLFVKDTDGRFLMANKAFCEPMNLDPETIRGKIPVDVWEQDEEEVARRHTEDKYVMESDSRLELPAVPITYGETTRWYHVIKTPLHDHEGNVVGVVGSRMDITDRVHIQDQLRQMEKMEVVGKLAGGVAHEFNNILHMILGFTELMIGNIPAGDPNQQNLNIIKSASEKGASLVRQLLGYSRKQILQPTLVDINELLASTAQIMISTLGGRIVFQLKPGRNLPNVYADGNSIEQILLNLCLNGRDAMPDGGNFILESSGVYLDETFCGENQWARPGGFVRISVTDTGTGIPDDVLPRIFDPFFTTKGPQEGSGLGLSMVHGLMVQQKGCLNVTTAVNQGTTFDLYFPVPEEEGAANLPAPAKTPEEAPRPQAETAIRGTILVVEDEAGVQQLAKQVLVAQGFGVLHALHGEEGLQLFEQHAEEISLVLLDIFMPGMDGKELYERIIALNPDTPVIFHSGYHLDAKYTDYIAEKGATLLRKPYGAAALLQAVNKALEPSS